MSQTPVFFPILASLGGIATFATAVFFIVRSVVRLVNSTEANTKAVTELSSNVKENSEELHRLKERVARLEGPEHAIHP